MVHILVCIYNYVYTTYYVYAFNLKINNIQGTTLRGARLELYLSFLGSTGSIGIDAIETNRNITTNTTL